MQQPQETEETYFIDIEGFTFITSDPDGNAEGLLRDREECAIDFFPDIESARECVNDYEE
jgi:hypothetical protein